NKDFFLSLFFLLTKGCHTPLLPLFPVTKHKKHHHGKHHQKTDSRTAHLPCPTFGTLSGTQGADPKGDRGLSGKGILLLQNRGHANFCRDHHGTPWHRRARPE